MMKRMLAATLCLVVLILMIFPVCVSATESGADFSNVDWSTVDWNTIDPAEWLNWLDEAELKMLFQMSPRCDAGRAEGLAAELGRRFRSDPQGVIIALTAEEETIQTNVINLIVYNGQYYSTEFEQLLSNLTLLEDAGPEAMNILVQMVNRAEEIWGLDITNPQTGDYVGIAVLLMAFSGLGGALLWKKRKISA